jgi:hypothetical protein
MGFYITPHVFMSGFGSVCTVMNGMPLLSAVCPKDDRFARTFVRPAILAGLTRTKKHLNVSLVPRSSLEPCTFSVSHLHP